jgi:MerR HTH family regulatory protein
MTATTKIYSSSEVQSRAGITYRQLDHWARIGHVQPTGVGSGTRRQWSYIEMRTAVLLARLVKSGITLDTAAVVARTIWQHDDWRHQDQIRFRLMDGVHLVVMP